MNTRLLLAAFAMLAATNSFATSVPPVSKEWRSYTEPLVPIGAQLDSLLQDSKDTQLRAELYNNFFAIMAQGVFGVAYADPEHPDFWPVQNGVFNNLGPNPDNVYYLAAIADDGVYKISGTRGTVKTIKFGVGSGTAFTRGIGGIGPTLADYNADSLHINPDGTFEVLLSKTRPEGYQGDWWPLGAKAGYILVRQTSYDWVHEVDGRLAIERLDRPAAKPRSTPTYLDERMKELVGYAERNTRWSIEIVNRFRKKGFINKVLVHDFNSEGGLTTQKYIDGLFDLQPDEALIMETDVPKCQYWNFQLTDELYAAIDYVNRQTTLNGYSARLDADGKFRAVISAQDPGVPNWLDNAGYQRGMILGRWTECDAAPTPVITKVKIADIRKYLPTDTPVISAEARDASMRLRRKAAQMRRRW